MKLSFRPISFGLFIFEPRRNGVVVDSLGKSSPAITPLFSEQVFKPAGIFGGVWGGV